MAPFVVKHSSRGFFIGDIMIKSNLQGMRFARLVVLQEAQNHITPSGQIKAKWLCQCDCGKTKIVGAQNLKTGHTKSCGCISIEKPNSKKHGLAKHSIFILWSNIKARCYNPNNTSYKNYGGRGVQVCDEWKDNFKVFYNWCMENGWREGLQIDRENNDGNYEHSNCRFITSRQNCLNRRLLFSSNTSGFTGVHFNKCNQTWISSINIKGKMIYLGCHKDKKKAIKARNNYIINNKLTNQYKLQTER